MKAQILYPKVLLLGHSFNDYTGMGITLTNLFQEWPKDRIGIMSDEINIQLVDSIRPCALYSGITRLVDEIPYNLQKKTVPPPKSFIGHVRRIYYNFGLNEILGKSKILTENIDKAKAFAPDIVFCALGTLNRMKVCEKIMQRLNGSHLVIYIVDDWINSRVIEKKPLFVWKYLFHRSFKRILEISSGYLSICDAMSRSYLKQFGKQFVPFHNPVDISFWTNLKCDKKYSNDILSLLYVGKINEDTEECLIDCANCVEKINEKGKQIFFDVYSPDYFSHPSLFDKYPHCHLFKSVSHNIIPALTKSYDALFLTLGFTAETIKYIRLSMPTKLSEYLASEIPIVLYSPPGVALTEYISSKNCAFICTKRDPSFLKNTILQLFDKDSVETVSRKALEVARDHDIKKIRESFRVTMNNFTNS